MNRKSLVYLESLRGLAALAVVIAHLQVCFFFTPSAGLFVYAGVYSVRIFFLLSGFVLSLSFFVNRQPLRLVSAALRRYPRLMLPVLASVMFTWCLIQLHTTFNFQAAAAMGQPPYSPLNGSYLIVPTFLGALYQGALGTFFDFSPRTTLTGALWTMHIELLGSFLVFALLAIFLLIRPRWIIYAVTFAVLIAAGAHHIFRYLLDFVVGVALCDYWVSHRNAGRSDLKYALAVAAIAMGVGLGLWATGQAWAIEQGIGNHAHVRWFDPLATLGACLIVGASAFSSPLQTILEHPVCAFLGRISFPIYLIHATINTTVGCFVYLLVRQHSNSHFIAALMASLAALAVSVLVAWLGYYAVEQPSIRASVLFAKALTSRTRSK